MKDQDKTKKPKAFCKQFAMVDVPLHIVKEFCGDVKVKYGDIYWVKLMDLMRKAEAYDMLVGETVEEELVTPDEERTVNTLTGPIKG